MSLAACTAVLGGAESAAAAPDIGFPFEAAGSYPTSNTDLQAGDLNGDGTSDVVTYGSTEAQVLLGDGGGGFGDAEAISGLKVDALELADLNGDGALDIATANPVRTLLGDGAGGFAQVGSSTASGGGGGGLAVGDFTSDGFPDLLVLDNDGLKLIPGDGTGGLGAPVDVPVAVSPGVAETIYLETLAVGDIDEDSDLDAVVTAIEGETRYAEPLIIMRGDGAGGFTQENLDTGRNSPAQSMTLADLDGDGHLDIFTTDSGISQGGGTNLLYGDGNGGFTRADAQLGFLFGSTRPAIADFNSDGRLDIAATTEDRNRSGIALAIGASGRAFKALLRENGKTSATSGLETGSFGGNARPDLALIRAGVLEIQRNGGVACPDPGAGGCTPGAAPNTTITKGPANTINKRRVEFKFRSKAGSSFECKLNKRPYEPCVSPTVLRANRGRKNTFFVRAVDQSGAVDPTPAVATFRVKGR